MEPGELFSKANDLLKRRIAKTARDMGEEAFGEAEAHAQVLSEARQDAQQQVSAALRKAETARPNPQAKAAEVMAKTAAARAQTEALQPGVGAAAKPPAAPAGVTMSFEDAAVGDTHEIER